MKSAHTDWDVLSTPTIASMKMVIMVPIILFSSPSSSDQDPVLLDLSDLTGSLNNAFIPCVSQGRTQD